jgi:hypothetical protein
MPQSRTLINQLFTQFIGVLVTELRKSLLDLRTVVRIIDMAQSMYKQYRPGRGVVEIVSSLLDMVSITPFFCARE